MCHRETPSVRGRALNRLRSKAQSHWSRKSAPPCSAAEAQWVATVPDSRHAQLHGEHCALAQMPRDNPVRERPRRGFRGSFALQRQYRFGVSARDVQTRSGIRARYRRPRRRHFDARALRGQIGSDESPIARLCHRSGRSQPLANPLLRNSARHDVGRHDLMSIDEPFARQIMGQSSSAPSAPKPCHLGTSTGRSEP